MINVRTSRVRILLGLLLLTCMYLLNFLDIQFVSLNCKYFAYLTYVQFIYHYIFHNQIIHCLFEWLFPCGLFDLIYAKFSHIGKRKSSFILHTRWKFSLRSLMLKFVVIAQPLYIFKYTCMVWQIEITNENSL